MDELSLDYYISGGQSDRGCQYSPSCRECQFRDCIDGLRHTEKQLILQAPVVEKVLSLHDNGMSDDDILAQFPNLTLTQIRQWFRNRIRVVQKITKYQLTE